MGEVEHDGGREAVYEHLLRPGVGVDNGQSSRRQASPEVEEQLGEGLGIVGPGRPQDAGHGPGRD